MNKLVQRSHKMVLLVLAVACAVLFTFTILRAQIGAPSAPSSPKKSRPKLPLKPLSAVPNPAVNGLSNYVANQGSAIALGKALFWEQQVGSDGVQACASCHFNAGADSRTFNQADPGLRDKDPSSPDFNMFTLGVLMGNAYYPNYQLHGGTPGAGFGGYHDGDFPLYKPVSDLETVPYNTGVNHHDVISSQGVFARTFNSVTVGNSVDNSTSTPDSNFSYPDPSHPGQLINTEKSSRAILRAWSTQYSISGISGTDARATFAMAPIPLAIVMPRRISFPPPPPPQCPRQGWCV